MRQTRTVSQPTLNIKQIEETPILIPPFHLQQQFAKLVQKTETLKEKQKESEQELKNLFGSSKENFFNILSLWERTEVRALYAKSV
jgi:type I restriction enzyme S subunit